MLPKVTMKAPAQIDGGQIHASDSGKNYDIGEDGLVTVDSVDVRALHGMGFTNVPAEEMPDEVKAVTTSVSFTSATDGAQALDPEARSANQRTEIVGPEGSGPANVADFGGAIPPHSQPSTDTLDPKVKAGAALEAKAAAAAGADPSKPSAVAETGAPNQQAATKDQQQKAAESAKG